MEDTVLLVGFIVILLLIWKMAKMTDSHKKQSKENYRDELRRRIQDLEYKRRDYLNLDSYELDKINTEINKLERKLRFS